MNQKRSTFPSYLTKLQSEGRVVFTASEALEALSISAGALLDAAERQQKRNHLIRPRHGFYVIVPPQFHRWGAPPPPWYIDELMAHSDRPYYVGLLTAAELHGAGHQAVTEFQVITDRQLGPIRAGRSQLVFRYRKEMEGVADGIEQRKTDTGRMQISGVELTALRAGRSQLVFRYRKEMEGVADGIEQRKTDTGRMQISGVELTALDLLRYPRATGGLDQIATVLADLGPRIDPDRLAALSGAFERSVVQRLGYLLERLGYRERTDALHDALTRGGGTFWVELDPLEGADRDFSSAVVERAKRWRVKVRRLPDPDQ